MKGTAILAIAEGSERVVAISALPPALLSSNRTFPQRLTRKQLDPSRPDIISIVSALCPPLDHFHATRIAADLQREFENRRSSIDNLHIEFVSTLPIVKWREEHDVEVAMFYKISDLHIPCSWLMHNSVSPSNLRDKDCAFLRISVTSFGHLAELFESAKRVLGLETFSTHDLQNLWREAGQSYPNVPQ